ncbi:MAG TPA: deoxyribonuclease IV [Planctomycetota bacterium]|nr:deoxyribonuclease IV [Planctomycetota bacterium]
MDPEKRPLLGAHLSIAGGHALACARAHEAGCNALQIFVKNHRMWRASPLAPADADLFRRAREAAGVKSAFAHATYLLNLASPDPGLWAKSLDGFVDELARCDALGLDALVVHPGAAGPPGKEAAAAALAKALDQAVARTAGSRVRILLETAAGQGGALGSSFGELRSVVDRLGDASRIGFCLDTCHVFAAGYDLSTREGYDRTFEAFDRELGLRRLEAFHLNDSKKGLGSRVDRHEHIGKGAIGPGAFERLMRDRRFRDIPKVIETPKVGDMDRVNLDLLRRMAG